MHAPLGGSSTTLAARAAVEVRQGRKVRQQATESSTRRENGALLPSPAHRDQGSPFTTNPTSIQALGRVCSTNCVTTSSCTREQPRGSVHLIRHLASRLRRLAPSVTKLHVGHSAKGGGVANASPSRLLALGVVGSIERKEGRFNTNSALRGLVAAGVGGGG